MNDEFTRLVNLIRDSEDKTKFSEMIYCLSKNLMSRNRNISH